MFALFYNMTDLTTLAGILQRANLQYANNDDRGILRACWGGGLNLWQTAPLGGPPGENDPDCRVITVSATYKGQTITLTQMLDAFSRTVPVNPGEPDAYAGGIEFLNAIVQDARTTGKDPYP